MLTHANRVNLRAGMVISRRAMGLTGSSLGRGLSTMVVLEQRDGRLSHGSLSALAAARKVGGSIHGFVSGAKAAYAAAEASKVNGVEQVIVVENDKIQQLPEDYARLLIENIRNGTYTHVMAGHTAFGKSILPRAAALFDSQQISDVTAIVDGATFKHQIYAGNAVAIVESADLMKFLTVRGTAFSPAVPSSRSARIVEGKDFQAKTTAEWLSEDLAESDRPDLATARRVVSGGRGLKSKQEFDRVMLPFADALGAAVGASRAAVDSGYADNSLQVGQTGKVVAPLLYMAIGVSGAIQHLAGMKDSNVIAAINKDPDAPIFQVADVGFVGDLFQAVPELTQKLRI